MMPRLEMLAVLVASKNEVVRAWLAIAAGRAGCFSPVVQAAGARDAMKIVVRHICRWPSAPCIDLLVTDCAVPDLMGLGLVPNYRRGSMLRRPFVARLVHRAEPLPAAQRVTVDFDFVAPMPGTIPELVDLFRAIADHSLTRFAETGGALGWESGAGERGG